MTRRERSLWLIVGIAFIISIVYLFFFKQEGNSSTVQSKTSAKDGVIKMDLVEAYRLLQTERTIILRKKAVQERLGKVEAEFLSVKDPTAAQLNLLGEVEQIVSVSNLQVNQKNMMTLKDNVIAVFLEGTTGVDSLMRFLGQVANAKLNLQVYRLQVHALPEQKQLTYQIVISTLLIEKKGN